MALKVSIFSVEWSFFTRYGRKVDFSLVDFFSIECRKDFICFSGNLYRKIHIPITFQFLTSYDTPTGKLLEKEILNFNQSKIK